MRYLQRNEAVLSGRLFELSLTENRLSLKDFFSLAAAAGFTGVELRDSQIRPGDDPEEILELCNQYGLGVSLLTARGGRLQDESGFSRFLDYLALARQLGCPRLKVSGNNFELLRRAAAYAEDAGVRIGINNHIGTDWETPAGTFRMLDSIKHRNFFCHFDPSHWYLARAQWDQEIIRQLLPKIDYFIVQDYSETEKFPLLGQRRVRMCSATETGQVGYPMIAGILDKLQYAGPAALVALRDAEACPESVRKFFERSLGCY